MKILVICQYYYPEPFRISDICEHLVKQGHEVQVITGYPNYPLGELYDGYGMGKRIDEVINGVKVHRCYEVPRKRGTINRFLNYYSYPISSSLYVSSSKCKPEIGKKFDLVVCNQLSPVMMAKAAIKYKKKYNVPLLMYCLDLWPESLIAGGIKRNSTIYNIFLKISKKIYRKTDQIVVTSEEFKKYFKEKFCIDNTIFLPQYAESIFNPKECKKEDNDCVDLMFAGNIGKAQNVKIIIDAAKELVDIKNLKFHIVGDGTELENLKIAAQGLNNVVFYGRRPVEEMPALYSKADAMLVTMEKDPIISMTLPGKIQSYMAAGKPIIGSIDGEAQKVIKESDCGLCSNAENIQEFITIINKFISCKNKEKYKENSYRYYLNTYSENLFFDNLEEIIKKVMVDKNESINDK